MKELKGKLQEKGKTLLVLGVILLLLNLPVISALTLSEIQAAEVKQTSAAITWNTDEPANSFVNYGSSREGLQRIGDAREVNVHRLELTNLIPATEYFFSVQSKEVVDDNNGELYSFTSLAPDTEAPTIEVELPEYVQGTETEVTGTTEAGTSVRLYINGIPMRTMPAGDGQFLFRGVVLRGNEWNSIKIESTDENGNVGVWEGQVFADVNKPKLSLEEIPSLANRSTLRVKGVISENASYEITLNGNIMASGTGNQIDEEAALQEGSNLLKIKAKDAAGWETEEEFSIVADTQPPSVTAEIDKGNEYYENRASSSIHGTTEPGAKVYLYVYRPLGYEFTPKFDEAREVAEANENGEFVFEEVDFEDQPLSLEKLAPREVPSGLVETTIYPIQQVAEQEQKTVYIYVIAEDRSGKSGYWSSTINTHRCSSSSFAFSVDELTQFHSPLRLNPQLLDDGRETIQAVYNLSYRGSGVPNRDIATGEIVEAPYRVLNVDFDPACVPGSEKDEKLQLGCKILPKGNPRVRDSNMDKTAWYIAYNLHSSKEFSEGSEDYWNEFKKRQLVFPLKIRVSFQERNQDGSFSETRFATQCMDLSYFVDIPVDSKKMLPDFIAEEGLAAIDWTLEKIGPVIEYVEIAIKITGVGCITSFLGRMAVRWARIFTSHFEAYTSFKSGEKKCPPNQDNLYLKSTLEHWKKLQGQGYFDKQDEPSAKLPTDKDKQQIRLDNPELVLDEKCPNTANMWKAEAALDAAYKWTCDRVFCRAVPARWTADRTKEQVDNVILKQNQCTASSRCVPLIERENCQELIKQNQGVANVNPLAAQKIKDGGFVCYQNNEQLYVITSKQPTSELGEIVKLDRVHDFGLSLQEAGRYVGVTDLYAYRAPNSDQYCVAKDTTCANECKNPRKPGYKADKDGGITSVAIKNFETSEVTPNEGHGCYREKENEFGEVSLYGKKVGGKDQKISGTNTFPAGYTKDCFIEFKSEGGTSAPPTGGGTGNLGPGETCTTTSVCAPGSTCVTGKCELIGGFTTQSKLTPKDRNLGTGETGLLQCVCTVDKEASQKPFQRIAGKEVETASGMVQEDWIYQQDEIYKRNPRFGTYYPEWRYYAGRDFPSAFGQDHVTDYAKDKNEKEVTQVNHNTQFLAVYQTMCLSRIRAHLVTLQSILTGLKLCIQEAKITGLVDAGMCKTLFTQHICGLVYKAIAYFFTKCSPYSISDETKGGALGDVGYALQTGFASMGEAMDTSIQDIKNDYGNAKLNEYFATGSQGFVESLCLFAFGYDWPLGMDFIEDAAYSVPGKTTPLVVPAERELSTFNPKKGTAVYNYNIGAVILPGCGIRSYDVFLKCIGPEDRDRPGVQCGTQGCDCLNARNPSAFEGERIKYLDGGRGGDLPANQMSTVPMEMPQKVDAQFRYDHVGIQLHLNQYEDEDKCFEEGYRDGLFYFPIIDTTPPGMGVCQVDIDTGRYICPEIVGLFGGTGGSFLEDPYISCYDARSGAYVDCKTPNLFIQGDEIKVKVHVYNDGKGQCLKVTASGLTPGIPQVQTQKLFENMPGPYRPEIPLGSVTEKVLQADSSRLLLQSGSGSGCSQPRVVDLEQEPPTGLGTLVFEYERNADGYFVYLPQNVMVEGNDYKIETTSGGKRRLTKNNQPIPHTEMSTIVYNINGYKVEKVVGMPSGDKGSCGYVVTTTGSRGAYTGEGYYPMERQVQVRAEVLQPDVNGDCFNSRISVKPSGFGKPSAEVTLTLQKESQAQQLESRMHESFLNGNYNYVTQNAESIVRRNQRDLEEAIAIYYYIAALIALGKEQWATRYQLQVCNLLAAFEKGADGMQQPYGPEVTQWGEYQKVNAYLKEVKEKFKEKLGVNANQCSIFSQEEK